jgi:hypothetical protein
MKNCHLPSVLLTASLTLADSAETRWWPGRSELNGRGVGWPISQLWAPKKEQKIHQVPQMIFRCSKLWVENGGSHMKYHEIITDFGKHSGDPQDHSPVPWKSLPQCVAMRRHASPCVAMRRHASPSATPPIRRSTHPSRPNPCGIRACGFFEQRDWHIINPSHIGNPIYI